MKRHHTRAEWQHLDGNQQYRLRKEREAAAHVLVAQLMRAWRGPLCTLPVRRQICN
jgi:hypothetical protein